MQPDFSSATIETDIRHQAAHQADPSAMSERRGTEVGSIGHLKIEARPGIAHHDDDIRRIRGNAALDRLRRIVAATVKRRISQRFLQRNQDVDLVSFVVAVLADELQDFFSRRRDTRKIAGKNEFHPRNLHTIIIMRLGNVPARLHRRP